MDTENPRHTGIGIGVPAVQSVFVVQLDHDPQGIVRRFGPMQDLFAPQHAQIVVDDALAHELALGGVPELAEALELDAGEAGVLDGPRSVAIQVAALAEERYVSPQVFAWLAAGRGDVESTLDALESSAGVPAKKNIIATPTNGAPSPAANHGSAFCLRALFSADGL